MVIVLLQDCVRIYQAVLQLPNVIGCLKGYHGDHQILLDEVFINPLQVNCTGQ